MQAIALRLDPCTTWTNHLFKHVRKHCSLQGPVQGPILQWCHLLPRAPCSLWRVGYHASGLPRKGKNGTNKNSSRGRPPGVGCLSNGPSSQIFSSRSLILNKGQIDQHKKRRNTKEQKNKNAAGVSPDVSGAHFISIVREGSKRMKSPQAKFSTSTVSVARKPSLGGCLRQRLPPCMGQQSELMPSQKNSGCRPVKQLNQQIYPKIKRLQSSSSGLLVTTTGDSSF